MRHIRWLVQESECRGSALATQPAGQDRSGAAALEVTLRMSCRRLSTAFQPSEIYSSNEISRNIPKDIVYGQLSGFALMQSAIRCLRIAQLPSSIRITNVQRLKVAIEVDLTVRS